MSDSSYKLRELRGAEHEKAAALREIERAKKLERLMLIPEFKELIMQDFIVDETVRVAEMAGNPGLTPEMRESAMVMVTGGGHLRRWMKLILDSAARFSEGLPELDEAILDLRQEIDAMGVER